MPLLRVAHVNLSVDQLEPARRFYGELLGLVPAPRPGAAGRNGCWFLLGAVELHLSEDPGSSNAGSNRHVAFEVDDLGSLRERLAEAGVVLEEARPLPGMTRFFAFDPSGNRLEFYSR